jgi:hypothetical protein
VLKENIRSLITDVQNRITEDRGKFVRILKRGELGGEVDSLNDKLSFWGTRFRVNLFMLYNHLVILTVLQNNRLVDIQIEQNVVAGNVRKILDKTCGTRFDVYRLVKLTFGF